MSESRTTMRPITLRRVVEICELALREKEVSEQKLVKIFGTTKDRAHELLFEIQRMKLITPKGDAFVANRNTQTLIETFKNENWQNFGGYFLKNYSFYQFFVKLLSSHLNDPQGLLMDQAIMESKSKRLPLNQTSIEVLTNWCERLGIMQRHLYEKRFYLLKDFVPEISEFAEVLQECYHSLNIMRGLDLRLVYVDIPRLREDVCERLKISREIFDELLLKLYKESVGKIELSGAPTITIAKKSPLTIRTIKAGKKEDILAPRLDLTKERKGIEIEGKSYYYIAIHEKLR